jgi:serine/threonine protein kinase
MTEQDIAMSVASDVVVCVPCVDHYPQFKEAEDVKGFEGEYDRMNLKLMKTIDGNLFVSRYATKNPMFISAGTYGEVYRYESQSGTYAIKKFRLLDAENVYDQVYTNCCMEVIMLKSISHPNIVRILDAGMIGGYLHAAFDYYENNLSCQTFKEIRQHHKNWQCAMLKQISHALAYLHSQQIIHRDIKPTNILFRVVVSAITGKKYIHFALCDFGAAIDCKLYDKPVVVQTKVTTPMFEAPEMMFRSRMYTSAVDIFALGCTLYYTMTGGEPLLPPNIGDLDPSDGFALMQGRLQCATSDERAFFATLPAVNLKHIDLLWSISYCRIDGCKHIGMCNTLFREMVSLHPNNRPTAAQVHMKILAIIKKQREISIAYKQAECKVL